MASNDTFEKRKKRGDKSEKKTVRLFKKESIPCGKTVYWTGVKKGSEKWKKLREKDERVGDRWLIDERLNFTVDIKTSFISLRSIENFAGTAFLIWSPNLSECRVIYPNSFKNINKRNCVELPSGDHGFSYEQVKTLDYVTLDHFIKTIKAEYNIT